MQIPKEAQLLIDKLRLVPLPEEGGFYREVFRSKIRVSVDHDGSKYERSAGTSIYYLIAGSEISALHRVKHDECFYFLQGTTVEMLQIGPEGPLKYRLGSDIAHDEYPQIVALAGYWQGLRVCDSKNGWALFGTAVAPGFEFEDFELADRAELLKNYPDHQAEIRQFTR